jgi:surface antigen
MGLFACAVFFIVGSNNASAASISETELSISSQTIERIVDVNETSQSPLLSMVNDKTEIPEEKPALIAPTVIKHVVSNNESLSKIAEIHNTTWQRIYDKNTNIIDPDNISVGLELTIPTVDEVIEARVIELPKIEPTNNRVRTSSTVSQQSAPASSSGNKYIAGYCTWYVKNRRPDLPNNLGNASTWVSRALAQGLATGSTPVAGAVGQQGNHVVYIESVNGDGTVTVSEMNQVGWNVISTRTVPAGYFSYIY